MDMDPRVRLRQWRERRGLTYAELARSVGCHGSLISKIEHGQRLPGRRTALSLERVTEGAIRAGDWDESEPSQEAS